MKIFRWLKRKFRSLFHSEPTVMAEAGIVSFLRAAAENEQDVLIAYPDIIDLIDRIDLEFRTITTERIAGEPLPKLLLLNAHACFLSAARSAISGQSPPTFMTLRGSIENALYAIIVADDPAKAKIWHERMENRKLCRDTFTPAVAFKILARDDPNLGIMLREAYDLSIDYGAHPNPMGVLPHRDRRAKRSRHRAIGLFARTPSYRNVTCAGRVRRDRDPVPLYVPARSSRLSASS